jgi:hypothetical protein
MDALETLFHHARGDTGGSKRCATFLLSLWNGDNFKADLQEILYNDSDIFHSMMEVLSRAGRRPATYSYRLARLPLPICRNLSYHNYVITVVTISHRRAFPWHEPA